MRRGKFLDSVSAVVLCVALSFPVQPVFSVPTRAVAANSLQALSVRATPDTTDITVRGAKAPTFTTFRLERPMRLFVDVAGGDVSAIRGARTVGNGVVRSINVQPMRRGGGRYGRLTVTFDRDALYHVRADGTSVVIVVDGTDRKLSKAQNDEIAAVREAAKSAAAREKELLGQLRSIRDSEKSVRAAKAQAESQRAKAVAEQKRLQAEMAQMRKAGHAARDLNALKTRSSTLAKRVADAQSHLAKTTAAMQDVQGRAAALRKQLRDQRQGLADVITQRRAEEARIALLRQQIARERKDAERRDDKRIAALQTKLQSARSHAEQLRKEAKAAQDARRQAQAEEVARLKAEIKRRDQAIQSQLRSVALSKKSRAQQVSRSRAELKAVHDELRRSQSALVKARQADRQRDVAERRWRAAEARAQLVEKRLAERERELAKAKKAMAAIARQQDESSKRAAQIRDLLQRREGELSSAREQLRAKETSLASALAAARRREDAAIAAGKQREVAIAKRERARLEATRKQLDERLGRQKAALNSLRAELNSNARARARAEKEASTLRTNLAARQTQLHKLLVAQQQGRAESRNAQRQIANLRKQMDQARSRLKAQTEDRERQLDKLELQLGRRVKQVQAELAKSRRTNDALSRDLDNARQQAAAGQAALHKAEERVAKLAEQQRLAENRAQEQAKRRRAAERRVTQLAQRQEQAERRAAQQASLRKESLARVAKLAVQQAAAEKRAASLAKQHKSAQARAAEQLARRLAAEKRAAEATDKRRAAEALAAKQLAKRQAAEKRLAEVAAKQRAAEARASKQVAQREKAERLAAEAMTRAERVASLLQSRERELNAMRTELSDRAKTLNTQLRQARAREAAARKAGKAGEASVARKLRESIERERRALTRQMAKQDKALKAARAEATANSTARVRAEKEARALRKALASREAELARLAAKRKQGAANASRVAKAEQQVNKLRSKLMAQLAERDRKLQSAEKTARTRARQARVALDSARKQLDGARKRNDELQRKLGQALQVAERTEKARVRAEKLASEAMTRARRITKLLDDRKRELTAVRGELKKREASLMTQLKRARAREDAARRAGKRGEAVQAKALRRSLEEQRARLTSQLSKQERQLADARAEAGRNASARARAEKEAATLRRELKKREATLARLHAKADRSKVDSKLVAAATRHVQAVRNKLLKQLAERDRRLQSAELQLKERVAIARQELAAARTQNDKLSRELQRARQLAKSQKAARVEAENLARTRDRARIRAEKLATEARQRAARVADLLKQRESELQRIHTELSERANLLKKELARAEQRERKARRKGLASEAAAAARARRKMLKDMGALHAERARQQKAARTAAAEAKASAAARARAEKEATRLRKEVAQRERKLAALQTRAARAEQLEAARRRVEQARHALEKKLAARETKLARVEKELQGQVADVRSELDAARNRNAKLSDALRTAQRDRNELAKKAAKARTRAERIAKMLTDRETELRRVRDKLGTKEKELAARLAKATRLEKKAREQGRAAEAGRAAKLRKVLQSSLMSLQNDLGSARRALHASKAEAIREEKARRRSEERAARLAAALRAREGELTKLRKRSGNTGKRVQDAERRVAQARDQLRRAAAQRDATIRKMEAEVQRRIQTARAQMATAQRLRQAELARAQARASSMTRAQTADVVAERHERVSRTAELFERVEEELKTLKKHAQKEAKDLKTAKTAIRVRHKAALKSGNKALAKAIARELKLNASRTNVVQRTVAARNSDLARLRSKARHHAKARKTNKRKLAALLSTHHTRSRTLDKQRAAHTSMGRIKKTEAAVSKARGTLQSAVSRELRADADIARGLNRQLRDLAARRDAWFAGRQKALDARYAQRETSMKVAMKTRPRPPARAVVAAAPVATPRSAAPAKPALDNFVRKQQMRMAILEARAERERERRQKASNVAQRDRARAAVLERRLADARKSAAAAAKARINEVARARAEKRAAEKRAKRMVEQARRQALLRTQSARTTEARRRMRAEAALERMRARQIARNGKHVASRSSQTRILDLNITAEGYLRGRVELPVSGKPDFEVESNKGRRVVLRMRNARLPSRLQRVYDTRALRGPIERVTAFMPKHRPGEARVVVDLAARTSNVISVASGRLIWDFIRTDGRRLGAQRGGPAHQGVPVGGDIRARTPQPRMQQFGGGGAGVNSNPIRTPWRNNRRYTGKRINLTIKDADIHHVLTFLAKEGSVNIVAGPEVAGSVTFHLENIPWDLALDVILRARGLDYVRQSGVIRVSTLDKLKKEFDEEVARRKAVEEVKQLVVRIIPVNYGQATTLRTQVQEILSKRGSVTVDQRTNALVVKDTEEHVAAVEEMIRKLDSQTPQVLVEARIVEASSNFTKEVGIQWGGNMAASSVYGNETGLAFPSVVGVAGGADGGNANAQGVAIAVPNYAVNLPAAVGSGAGGAIGLTLGSLGGAANLNLRLSAAEQEGTVKIVSSPKVLTLDNREARIRQGISIPISVVSAQGVQTRFFDADLRLIATPHITQDGNILMQIQITKNEPDFSNRAADGNPTITQREARTELLLGDGETTVIGGIYTRSSSQSVKKVPFFGDLPLIGGLFRSRSQEDKRSELLIFITPRIVNRAQAMTVGK